MFSLTDPGDFNRLSQDLFNLISDEDYVLVLRIKESMDVPDLIDGCVSNRLC